MNQWHDIIAYAQCWEDPRTLTEALEITPQDDILSTASGGDNTLALLLEEPRTLTAIDRNPAQLYLLELKMRAIQSLEYSDFVSFVGARPSNRRKCLYKSLRVGLSHQARDYWDRHGKEIVCGIIHCGKFERYFSLFRRYVLPLIHNQKEVERLLRGESKQDQKKFYSEVWNNWRWRLFFQLFFGEFILGRLGRHRSLFQYVTLKNIAEELLARTRRGLTEIPTSDNFFLEYILTGHYRDLEKAHPYLRESNFERLRSRVDRIRLVNADVEEYLASLPAGSFTKINCSDIFEYMSGSAFGRTLRAIVWGCRKGARVAFWTLFVPREVPASLNADIDECKEVSGRLTDMDRTFFYESFRVWQIHKQFSNETSEIYDHARSWDVRTP